MSPELQIAGYSGLLSVVVGLNLWGRRECRERRDPDTLGIALMILLVWAVSRVVSATVSQDAAMRLWPLLDFGSLCTCLMAWSTSRNPEKSWKLGMGFLYLTQLWLHAEFWTPPPTLDKLVYTHGLNLVFLLQLGVVGWRGVKDGGLLAGSRRPRLFFRRGPGHRQDR